MSGRGLRVDRPVERFARQETIHSGVSSMNLSSIKQTSAWLPIVLSLAALALVLGHVAMYGVVREADEGTPAHLFQLLMVAQVPLVAFFALKWLPLAPGGTVRILALQATAALTAFAAVYWLT